eukprot:GHVL01005378.1.p1 GENE.GHVL01005378.1~~GHVL01005378.1.p1  ORF type:complete len:627 (+),score=110.79 GHVL01005378.1:68-1948(+)
MPGVDLSGVEPIININDASKTSLSSSVTAGLPSGSHMSGKLDVANRRKSSYDTSTENCLKSHFVHRSSDPTSTTPEIRIDKNQTSTRRSSLPLSLQMQGDVEDETINQGYVASSLREIITLHVGRAGVNMGHEFWKDVCEEHRINYHGSSTSADIGRYYGDSDMYMAEAGVFFSESSTGRYVPRAILCDLDNFTVEGVLEREGGSLYRPKFVHTNNEGSSNCYGKARHVEGQPIVEDVMDCIRSEVEKLDSIQGVIITHSLAGGTGSGMTSLLLESLTDFFKEKGTQSGPILSTFSQFPNPNVSDIVLEPYNCILGTNDLIDLSDLTFVSDNGALMDICQRTLKLNIPRFPQMDNINARVLSGITASLRFQGDLNADLRNMYTNLVPFQRLHFLISSFAPQTSNDDAKYRNLQPLDLVQQMMLVQNTTVSCDQLNWAKTPHDGFTSRYLASFALFRGSKLYSSTINKVLYQVPREPKYDKHFPEWIPNVMASSVCNVPHPDFKTSVTYIANSTAFEQVLKRNLENWEKMYKQRSHWHTYEQFGVTSDEMTTAANNCQALMEEYQNRATVVDDLTDADNGKPHIILEEARQEASGNAVMESILDDMEKYRECWIVEHRSDRWINGRR